MVPCSPKFNQKHEVAKTVVVVGAFENVFVFIFGGNILEYTKSVGEKKENMLKYLGEVFFGCCLLQGSMTL